MHGPWHFLSLSRSSSSGRLLLFSTLVFALSWSTIEAQDSGTFFLKAAKNVPRIGRRSGGGKGGGTGGESDFFLNAAKNVPRIGRRGGAWSPGLTEMHVGGGLPWFRSTDNNIPSRVARAGPASIGYMWDGPPRALSPMQPSSATNHERPAGQTFADDVSFNWHGSNTGHETGAPVYRYEIYGQDQDDDEEADVSMSQLLAPPPPANFPRLPFEGAMNRQRRNEQQN